MLLINGGFECILFRTNPIHFIINNIIKLKYSHEIF
jgi:hypothetical protein